MSECISSWPKNSNQEHEQLQATEHIGERALQIVDRTYGSGYPEWQPGRRELAYHNGRHGRAVGNTALRLCDTLGLSRTEQAIARTSGFAHDIIHKNKRGLDEAESAEWLDTQLEKTGVFPPHLRRIGALAILGTEPLFSNGLLTSQRASTLDYPNRTTELIAKSVASADLGVLYTPEGPYQSHQLLREIKGMISPDQISLDDMASFQRNQIKLLETYRYPLKKADTVLATHKRQVINYSKDTLQSMERGDIESWDQLIKRDTAFIRTHGQ